MAEYRVYSLSANGSIVGDRTIEAVDDDEAVFAARAMKRPEGCEVWKGDRRVARVPPVGD